MLDDPVIAQYTHTLTVTGRLGGKCSCNVLTTSHHLQQHILMCKVTLLLNDNFNHDRIIIYINFVHYCSK